MKNKAGQLNKPSPAPGGAMAEVGVALLGFGTVGGGVADLLNRNGDLIAARAGVRPVLRRVADQNLQASPEIAIDRSLFVRDAAEAVADPSVSLVVELIGGTGAARECVLDALRRGKPVITANKALLAHHGAELFAESRRCGVPIYFEASVGGGIPVLRALREGLIADRVSSVLGIVNGTCNYILTRMEEQHCEYDEALAAARAKGYAERDPSLDVDGWDTAHKAVVLAALALGAWIPLDRVSRRGIAGLDARDIELAAARGLRIKLLALIRNGPSGLEVGVEPCLVPAQGLLGPVRGVFNAVLVRASPVGDTLYYGRGAGREATASAVAGDIAEAAARLVSGGGRPAGLPCDGAAPALTGAGDVEAQQYLRVSFPDDRAGERTEAAWAVLGRHGLHPLEAHAQTHAGDGGSSLVLRTRTAPARSADAAAAALAGLPGAEPRPVRLRIEEV
jgi:homoserine dehydrogenase